jgi:uncharacterized protein (DUF2147 family)
MRIRSIASFIAIPLLVAAFSAQAQSPVGRWKTIDDETGKVKSIVEISQAADGTLVGRVAEILHSTRGPDPVCDQCTGANKDKPVKGMTILWGLRDEGDGEYAGGRILDPAKGKDYKAKLELVGEDRLGVSGCIAFFCREQVWIRE